MNDPFSTILYVEDEQNDVFLMRLAFTKAHIAHPLQSVQDGEEAIAYLQGTGPYAERERYPFPGLVFLDLNLPRRSGLEVLRWIRQEPTCAHLPVVIYSSSAYPRDREAARELGANAYILKACLLDEMVGMVQKVIETWLDHYESGRKVA